MKILFSFMARSDKKYADPTGVLKAIVDDFGNPVEIGDQKDIGEFNSTFLSRISEGLNSNELVAEKYKLRELEERKD
jgi:ubiquitin carboxyl-terminal hydrolase 25/28